MKREYQELIDDMNNNRGKLGDPPKKIKRSLMYRLRRFMSSFFAQF